MLFVVIDMEKVLDSRNYGIDLLRIVSMFMVVILHVLGSGGLLDATGEMLNHNRALWLLEIFCYCAVNCYAIISGYVGYKSKFKFTNIVMLWLQVFFYTFLINCLFWLFKFQSISFVSLKSAFLPVMNRDYWYFTAYFIMFMFIPILNVVLEKFDKKQMGVILGGCFVLLSVVPTILMLDPFNLMEGYSFGWLMYLYLIGGYIRKYNLFSKDRCFNYIIYYICLALFTFLSKIGLEFLSMKITGEIRYNMMFIKYTSPTILLCAIFLVVAFSKLNVKRIAKLITFFAPLAFSVYLIHNNPLILNKFWSQYFIFLKDMNILFMIFGVFLCALCVYFVCSFIDFIRLKLFKFLKIKDKLLKLENKYLNGIFN